MLVVEEENSLRLVTQSDHAHLAHRLLSLWVADGMAGHPRREELLEATARHDSGWRGLDSAPPVDPSRGWPYDFRDLPRDARQQLWTTALRELDPGRWSSLLILRHAQALLVASPPDPESEDFLAWLTDHRAALAQGSAHDLRELEGDYALLSLADTLSLGACGVWGRRRFLEHGYDISLSAGHIVLQPFPFAGALELRVSCRSVAKRRYAGEADLGAELGAARWESFPIRVEPRTAP